MLLVVYVGSFVVFLFWCFVEGMLIFLLFVSSVVYIGECWSGGVVIELISFYVVGIIFGGFVGCFFIGLLIEEWDWCVVFWIFVGLILFIVVVICVLFFVNFGRYVFVLGKCFLVFCELFWVLLLLFYVVGFCVFFFQVVMFIYIGIYFSCLLYSLDIVQFGLIYVVFFFVLLVIFVSGCLVCICLYCQLLLGVLLLGVCGLLLILVLGLLMIFVGLVFSVIGVFFVQFMVNVFIVSNVGIDKVGVVGFYLICYYVGGSFGVVLLVLFWECWGWLGCLGLIFLVQLLLLFLICYGWFVLQVECVVLCVL